MADFSALHRAYEKSEARRNADVTVASIKQTTYKTSCMIVGTATDAVIVLINYNYKIDLHGFTEERSKVIFSEAI